MTASRAMTAAVQPSTVFLLLAQFGGAAIVPLELVRQQYFGHLTKDKFLRQLWAGKIPLPVVRMTESRKTARGVHLNDLAAFIDRKHALALKECEQLKEDDD
jgi:hypothetical protein